MPHWPVLFLNHSKSLKPEMGKGERQEGMVSPPDGGRKEALQAIEQRKGEDG
jgi:hypothetical protein